MKIIKDKIEKIRQKPEHIRLRWVWIMTIFFMLIVFGIWMISLSALKTDKSPVVPENQKQAVRELQQEKKSIQESLNEIKEKANNKKISQ